MPRVTTMARRAVADDCSGLSGAVRAGNANGPALVGGEDGVIGGTIEDRLEARFALPRPALGCCGLKLVWTRLNALQITSVHIALGEFGRVNGTGSLAGILVTPGYAGPDGWHDSETGLSRQGRRRPGRFRR